MEERLMKLDLQFFAEDEGAEEPEAAEPVVDEEQVTVDPEEGGVEDAEPAEQQTDDQNRIYAAMRRKAEYDAQMKYQAKQQRIDAMYAEKFRGLTNPETGAPITGAADYYGGFAWIESNSPPDCSTLVLFLPFSRKGEPRPGRTRSVERFIVEIEIAKL